MYIFLWFFWFLLIRLASIIFYFFFLQNTFTVPKTDQQKWHLRWFLKKFISLDILFMNFYKRFWVVLDRPVWAPVGKDPLCIVVVVVVLQWSSYYCSSQDFSVWAVVVTHFILTMALHLWFILHNGKKLCQLSLRHDHNGIPNTIAPNHSFWILTLNTSLRSHFC